MNLHRWLAAVFVILALVGCAHGLTGPEQSPHAPNSPNDHTNDRGPDM
jgi:hypothetical protein